MNKKKVIMIVVPIIIVLITVLCILFIGSQKKEEEKKNDLPLPEVTGGSRGQLGIDKNINEETIDNYLNREDSVYRDMRMLDDPGNYESIGGDSKLSGYIKGFEVIPLPYIIPVTGLPSSVGDTYQGTTLFSIDSEGKYHANYEESMSIIEKYFPKDKYIFLMCGGGGYAGMMKAFLVSLGWDTNKIYNIGGYWYYKGNNNVQVSRKINDKTSYDFDKVPYVKIEFSDLTEVKETNVSYEILITSIQISPSSLTLKVGEKYELTTTVVPNNATNKELIYSSTNESVATVDENGIITAIKPGKVNIIVKTKDNKKDSTSQITVMADNTINYLKLDDVTNESMEYDKYDVDEVYDNFVSIVDDEEGNTKEIYLKPDGRVNEEYIKLYDEMIEKTEEYNKIKTNIINQLVTNKKTFILLLEDSACSEKVFSEVLSAEKILKQNNLSYIFIKSVDDSIWNSKINTKNVYVGSILVINKGKVYAATNPEKDSFSKDTDVKKWLKKYIDIN